MIKSIIAFLLLTFSIPYVSAQGDIQNKAEAKVGFKVKNFGSYVNGQFSEVSISSNFDNNDLQNSHIKGSVNVGSIDTGNSRRDTHLKKEDYFDVLNYKTIALETIKIEKISLNKYNLTAKLTIKKTTKTVTIPAEITHSNNTIRLKTNFEINRLDYGVGDSSWVLSDEVKIEIIYIAKQ